MADVLAVLEEHGVKLPIEGTSKIPVAGFVEISEMEQKLIHKQFCFGRHRTKEAQAALWTIEELLELLRLRNDSLMIRMTMANDES